MLLIAATGNYNFFNLLTIVLALTLLDDEVGRGSCSDEFAGPIGRCCLSPTRWRTSCWFPSPVLAVLLGGLQVKEADCAARETPAALEFAVEHLRSSAFVNCYGLFRQMTETRPEILIEGSLDGIDWKPYEFRWKPGTFRAAAVLHAASAAARLADVVRGPAVGASSSPTGTIEPRFMSPWFQSFLFNCLRARPRSSGYWKKTRFPMRRQSSFG